MPPKKDSWSQSRTLRNGSLEAHVSLSVRGCSGERLSTFDTFFAESLTKLQDIISNLTDQSTQEARDQEGPLQQDPNAEGEANREGPEHDQTVQTEVREEDARGSGDPPQPKAGPRRRGPALMKRKCDVEDCPKKRSYSRALVTDAEKVFPLSGSDGAWVQLCRLHYEKVRRRR